MITPIPGSAGVSPGTSIVVSVPLVASWKAKTRVVINGVCVYHGGASRGWSVLRAWVQDGRGIIELAQRKMFEPKDYLVQVSVEDFRSVNQRFIVKGASFASPAPRGCRSVRVPGGFFWIDGCAWNVAGKVYEVPKWYGEGEPVGEACAVYRKHGMVAWLYEEKIWTVPLPTRYFSARCQLQMARVKEGFVLVSLDAGGAVAALWPDRMHVWSNAKAKSIGVTPDGWIHACAHDTSWHIQSEIRPGMSDRTLDDWWQLELEESEMLGGRWRMKWSQGLHVWWNGSELVGLVNPDPVMGTCDPVLWTKDDIGGMFLGVELMDASSVLVNDSLMLGMRDPVFMQEFT